MVKGWRTGAALAVAVLALGAVAGVERAAAGAGRHKADRIIRKHIRARGGMKKIRAVNRMKVAGYLQSQGVEFDFTIWMQRPNRSRMEFSIAGQDVVQAYDGRTAWWINPFAGAPEPQEMPKDYAQAITRWADFDGPLVNYKKKHHDVEFLGRRDLDDGTAAYEIRLNLASGDRWRVFIDTRTYLEVMRIYPQTFQGRTTDVVTRFSEFKEVNGVVTPTVINGVGLTGAPYTMVFNLFDADAGLPDLKAYSMP